MENQYLSTPLGTLEIRCEKDAIEYIAFTEQLPQELMPTQNLLLQNAAEQIQAYFAGKLQIFDLPLQMKGTTFQQEVWEVVSKIPFGKQISYKEIATALGKPKAVRAVGLANAHNKLLLVVPCHRVVGQDGSLVGYAGGIARKQWLLAYEKGEQQIF